MRNSSLVQKLRRAAVVFSTAILMGGVLLAAPQSAQALSSADLITKLEYTTPTSQFALRNEADGAAATFVSGDGDDTPAVAAPNFNDIYTIRLYHTAISLIPTVSAKATWSCDVSGDGTKVDEDCSVSGLTGGDETTVVITVEAENGDTNDYTFYIDTYATDASLSALTIDVGTLTPGFNTAVTGYAVTTGQDAFDIDPTATDGDATIVCKKGSLTLTGCAGALAVGSNSIVITVTAADGVTKRTYTVAITRVADTNNQIHKLTLSNGGLLTTGSGASTFVRASFVATTLAYDLTTNQDTLDITVDLKNEDGTFNCTVAGDVVLTAGLATGNASGDTCVLDLTGATEYTGNTLTIVVDPEGVGGTNLSYVFTITIDEDTVGNAEPTLTPGDATVQIGKRLALPASTAAVGLFDFETRVLYQWYVCDSDVDGSFTDLAVPTDCAPKGTGAAAYVPSTADVGKHVIGALIGHPGSALSFTDSVEVVGYPGLAVSRNIPAPEEAALVGAQIGTAINLENISLGDFTGITDVATEVDFQWYRCTSAATTATQGASLTAPSGCSKISGEDGDSYTPAVDNVDLTKSDAGKFLRVRLILNPPGTLDWMIFTRTTNAVFGPPVASSNPGSPSAPTSLTASAPSKLVTASNGSWSGNPTLVTTDPDNYSYQWYACSRPVTLGGGTDPTTLLDRDGNPRCEEIGGEVLKTVTIGTEWCGYYLLVGVSADNTDFRGKGGASDMRYSATSSSPVGGSACTY